MSNKKQLSEELKKIKEGIQLHENISFFNKNENPQSTEPFQTLINKKFKTPDGAIHIITDLKVKENLEMNDVNLIITDEKGNDWSVIGNQSGNIQWETLEDTYEMVQEDQMYMSGVGMGDKVKLKEDILQITEGDIPPMMGYTRARKAYMEALENCIGKEGIVEKVYSNSNLIEVNFGENTLGISSNKVSLIPEIVKEEYENNIPYQVDDLVQHKESKSLLKIKEIKKNNVTLELISTSTLQGYKVGDLIKTSPKGLETFFTKVNLVQEKSTSKSQQRLMGMVHAYQKGDLKDSDVSKSIIDIADEMKPSNVEDFASTKHKGLPEKVEENKDKKYQKNVFYDNKGLYLGIQNGQHKFKRHDADTSFKEYGDKYYYEKMNENVTPDVDDYNNLDLREERGISIIIPIFSHLSDIQEVNPRIRQRINFVKKLIQLMDDGQRQITDEELNKLWDEFN